MALMLRQGAAILRDCVKQIENVPLRMIAKSPGQSQKGKKRTPILWGLKKNPGDRVDERTVLGLQKRLLFHPGLNVGINPRDKSLYAICAGTVYFSIEKFLPNQANPLVNMFYQNKVNISSINNENIRLTPRYKKYIHVVPDKVTNEFKMIDIV